MLQDDCNDRDKMRSSHHVYDNSRHAFLFMIFLIWSNADQT
jgi:hypothetical protein